MKKLQSSADPDDRKTEEKRPMLPATKCSATIASSPETSHVREGEPMNNAISVNNAPGDTQEPTNAFSRFITRWTTTRSRRVTLLIVSIVLLSAADLIATLGQLRSIGMVEANPFASWVIQSTQSSYSLTCFKALSVLTCCGLLFKLRRSFQAELAAWICVLVLTGLSLHWGRYAEHASTSEFLASVADEHQHNDAWLTLVD